MSAQLTVVAPMALEAAAVRRHLDARVLRCGVGPERAARLRADLVSADGPVAVAGFAGATRDDVRCGDVVVATEVRGPDGTRSLPGAAVLAKALRLRGLSVHLAPVASSPEVVKGARRAALGAEGVAAVDMESSWLHPGDDRPFAVLRVALDTPGREVVSPQTLPGALRAYGTLARAVPALAEWAAATGKRRVLLAGPRSFCAGVERAIEIVEQALAKHGPPVYVRKQIVHNVHVVSDLAARGAVFVDELDEVPEGALVVFSAHGVSPQVREQAVQRGLRVIDATCPLVSKVHAEARRFAAAGKTIFLIGHAGHEEVEGTTGHAPQAIRLIERPEDIAGVEVDDPDKVAFLTQTTLSVDEAYSIAGALRERYPALTGPSSDDICYATQNRQDAVKAVARASDAVLVVGSRNSSNSCRLVEVVQGEGTPAYLIDDEADIDPLWLIGAHTLGVTAGASAPESLVQRVVDALAGLGPIEVAEHTTTTESIRFNLPKEVR